MTSFPIVSTSWGHCLSPCKGSLGSENNVVYMQRGPTTCNSLGRKERRGQATRQAPGRPFRTGAHSRLTRMPWSSLSYWDFNFTDGEPETQRGHLPEAKPTSALFTGSFWRCPVNTHRARPMCPLRPPGSPCREEHAAPGGNRTGDPGGCSCTWPIGLSSPLLTLSPNIDC